MQVWVTRDGKNFTANKVEFWNSRPKSNRSKAQHFYTGTDYEDDMSISLFKRLFGFTPRKGSCKQYELSLKEIL